MCDYQESVTTRQTDERQMNKVIPMCRHASQATQQSDPFKSIKPFHYTTEVASTLLKKISIYVSVYSTEYINNT